MGLKGSLRNTPFPNVLRTLAAQSATGLLRLIAPDGTHFLEFSGGLIAVASRTSSRNPLGELLIARGLITEDQFTAALNEQKTTGTLLGEVLLKQNAVSLETLETMLRFQVEEEIYDLFETPDGDFEFLQGAHLDRQLHATKGLVKLRVTVDELTTEALRRAEDWKQIRERVPDSGCLMNLTTEGSALLKQDEGLSVEGKTILRQVALKRSADAIAMKACLGRYNTYRMMMELTDAGLLQPATPQEYLQAAENAIEKLEFEEARRLAGTVARFFPSPHKERAEAILKRVEQKSAPKTTSAKVPAAPGAAQEISRRGTGRPLVDAQPSRAPWVAVLVVLLAVGGGAYWYMNAQKESGANSDRARLEELNHAAVEAISAGNLDSALDALKAFSTTNADAAALLKDLLEKRQRDIESRVELALNEYSKAQSGKDAPGLAAAIAALQKVRTVPLTSKSLDERRAQYLASADARANAQRSQEILQRIQGDLNAAPKGLGSEQLARLETALGDDPPETLLDSICVALTLGQKANTDAGAIVARAKALVGIGEVSTALLELEKAAAISGAPAAKEVDALRQSFRKILDDAQSLLTEVQAGAAKGQIADAVKRLKEFLSKPHPPEYRQAALDLLQNLEKTPDREFSQQLNAAILSYDKDPAASRKQSNALLDQQPFSKAAGTAALRLNVTSTPPGASVLLNGKALARTPALITVPALGGAWISLELDGFESADVMRWNLRDEVVQVELSRAPRAAKRLPFAALRGLDAGADRILALGMEALAVSGQADLKNTRTFVINRMRAQAENARHDPLDIWPPQETAFGGALVLDRDGSLYRVAFSTGVVQKTALQSPPTGPLLLARPTARGKERWILVPTQKGMESFDLATGAPRKALQWDGLRDGARSGCSAADDLACFPRDTQLYVVHLETGALKNTFTLEGEAVLAPYQAGETVWIPLKNGTLCAVSVRDGKTLWKSEGAAIRALIPQGGNILVQRDDGVDVLAQADGVAQAPRLKAAATLPFAVLLTGRNELSSLALTELAEGAHILRLANFQQTHWTARLPAKPVALAARDEAVFVALEDRTLLRFELNPSRQPRP